MSTPTLEDPRRTPSARQPRNPFSSVPSSPLGVAIRGVYPRPRLLQSVDGGLRFPSAITLLEMEPDLRRFLTPEQRAAAEQFLLPLASVEKNGDLAALIRESGAFGALVLDGLLLQTVQIHRHETLSLIGPGGLVPAEGSADWMPVDRSHVRAAQHTRLVLLNKEFVIAAHRWPWLVICLHDRLLEQSARLMKQLAIAQLPRVEDRVISILKLLAESWGRVTPAGIRLQLPLTHETLGKLIGARRPTVTIALRSLSERNAIIRRDKAWLITLQ